MITRRSRSLVFSWGLSVAIAVAVIGSAAAVSAQPRTSSVYVSNDAEDWSAEQRPFNPDEEVSIFIVFSTMRHHGFGFSGQCVLTLEATRQQLYRVPIDSMWLEPGQDILRTESLWIDWPNAAVDVTCVPDYAPSDAVSRIITPDLLVRRTSAGGTAYPPAYNPPKPPPVYLPPTPVVVQPPSPVLVTPPAPVVVEPPADCASTLLAMGHPASSLMFCEGVNNDCAVALLEAGHPPSSLIFCEGVPSACAVQLLRAGGQPSELIFCE